jgi:hypothetical protein
MNQMERLARELLEAAPSLEGHCIFIDGVNDDDLEADALRGSRDLGQHTN